MAPSHAFVFGVAADLLRGKRVFLEQDDRIVGLLGLHRSGRIMAAFSQRRIVLVDDAFEAIFVAAEQFGGLERLEQMVLAAAASREGTRNDATEGKRLVLLVDSDVNLTKTLGRVLARRGFESVSASSTREALAVWSERRAEVGVIAVDLGVDNREGVGLLLALLHEAPKLWSISMTSGGSTAGSAVADDVVRKPFGSSALVAAIERGLARRARAAKWERTRRLQAS